MSRSPRIIRLIATLLMLEALYVTAATLIVARFSHSMEAFDAGASHGREGALMPVGIVAALVLVVSSLHLWRRARNPAAITTVSAPLAFASAVINVALIALASSEGFWLLTIVALLVTLLLGDLLRCRTRCDRRRVEPTPTAL